MKAKPWVQKLEVKSDFIKSQNQDEDYHCRHLIARQSHLYN